MSRLKGVRLVSICWFGSYQLVHLPNQNPVNILLCVDPKLDVLFCRSDKKRENFSTWRPLRQRLIISVNLPISSGSGPLTINLVETCLIDEGNGVQYDLLELDQDRELNGSDELEEEEESSSDEVNVEINDLVPPSINTSTDKQDSGIDGIYLVVYLFITSHLHHMCTAIRAENDDTFSDKDSSPPTQPASPKNESTFDVRHGA